MGCVAWVEGEGDVGDLGKAAFESGVEGDGVFEGGEDGVAGDADYDAGIFEGEAEVFVRISCSRGRARVGLREHTSS